MDLLARREHSFHELVVKLTRKYSHLYHSAAAVDTVDEHCPDQEPDNLAVANEEILDKEALQALIYQQVSLLADDKLQSDERFIESFINGRKMQGKGPLRIRQELEQKRLPDNLITAYLDESDERWQLLAQQVYRKKFGDGAAKSYQEKAKRFRFMQYRGFSPAVLQSLVK